MRVSSLCFLIYLLSFAHPCLFSCIDPIGNLASISETSSFPSAHIGTTNEVSSAAVTVVPPSTITQQMTPEDSESGNVHLSLEAFLLKIIGGTKAALSGNFSESTFKFENIKLSPIMKQTLITCIQRAFEYIDDTGHWVYRFENIGTFIGQLQTEHRVRILKCFMQRKGKDFYLIPR